MRLETILLWPDGARETALDRVNRLEAELARLRAALRRIACYDDGPAGPSLDEPVAAAIAREALGGQ